MEAMEAMEAAETTESGGMAAETARLARAKAAILAKLGALCEKSGKSRAEVMASQKEMWREARMLVRDFDDAADIAQYADAVRGQKAQYARYVNEIWKYEKMLASPYFARVDFAEEGAGPDGPNKIEEVYVGPFTLMDEADGFVYAYDWRAPISGLFYDHGLGAAHFEVPPRGAKISGRITLKRQFQIEGGRLLYYFDNEIAVHDNILRQELSKSTEARIRTIINTIQREQNKAIRAKDGDVLVHGPAGSGKTSVGLHRLAYLLYKNRESLTSAKLRIFSPSQVFSAYIDGIIPELGEEEVRTLDFPMLLPESRPFENPFCQVERVAAAGGGRDLRLMWLRKKYSPGFIAAMERQVAEYAPDFSDIEYLGDTICGAKKLASLYEDKTPRGSLATKTERAASYLERCFQEYYRPNFRKIMEHYQAADDTILSDAEIRELFDQAKNAELRAIRTMCMPPAALLYRRALEGAAGDLPYDFARDCLEADRLFFEDALCLLYIDLLSGQAKGDSAVRHILLDEAQDFSPLHHKILRKMYPKSRFTVLADPNQALHADINIAGLPLLASLYPEAEVFRLDRSYRSTAQITEFAAGFGPPSAPYPRDGEPPAVIRTGDYAKEAARILAEMQKEHGTAAVILPTIRQAREFRAMLADEGCSDVQLVADDGANFTKGGVVIAAHFAKGLEFDAVVFPKGWLGEVPDRLMYLACTRALHRLFVLVGESEGAGQ